MVTALVLNLFLFLPLPSALSTFPISHYVYLSCFCEFTSSSCSFSPSLAPFSPPASNSLSVSPSTLSAMLSSVCSLSLPHPLSLCVSLTYTLSPTGALSPFILPHLALSDHCTSCGWPGAYHASSRYVNILCMSGESPGEPERESRLLLLSAQELLMSG